MANIRGNSQEFINPNFRPSTPTESVSSSETMSSEEVEPRFTPPPAPIAPIAPMTDVPMTDAPLLSNDPVSVADIYATNPTWPPSSDPRTIFDEQQNLVFSAPVAPMTSHSWSRDSADSIARAFQETEIQKLKEDLEHCHKRKDKLLKDGRAAFEKSFQQFLEVEKLTAERDAAIKSKDEAESFAEKTEAGAVEAIRFHQTETQKTGALVEELRTRLGDFGGKSESSDDSEILDCLAKVKALKEELLFEQKTTSEAWTMHEVAEKSAEQFKEDAEIEAGLRKQAEGEAKRLSEKNKRLEDQVHGLIQDISDSEAIINNARNSNVEQSQEIEQLRNSNEEQSREIEDLQRRSADQQQFAAQQQDDSVLDSQEGDLPCPEELAATQQRLRDCEQLGAQKDADYRDLMARCNDAERQVREARTQLEQLREEENARERERLVRLNEAERQQLERPQQESQAQDDDSAEDSPTVRELQLLVRNTDLERQLEELHNEQQLQAQIIRESQAANDEQDIPENDEQQPQAQINQESQATEDEPDCPEELARTRQELEDMTQSREEIWAANRRLEQELEGAQEEVERLQEQIRHIVVNDDCPEELRATRVALADRSAELARATEEVGNVEATLRLEAARVTVLTASLDRAQEDVEDFRRQWEGVPQLEQLQGDLERCQEEVAGWERALQFEANLTTDAETQRDEARDQVTALQQQLDALANDDNPAGDLQDCREEVTRLQGDLDAATASLDNASGDVNTAREAQEAAEAATDTALAERDDARADLETRTAERDQARTRIDQLEGEGQEEEAANEGNELQAEVDRLTQELDDCHEALELERRKKRASAPSPSSSSSSNGEPVKEPERKGGPSKRKKAPKGKKPAEKAESSKGTRASTRTTRNAAPKYSYDSDSSATDATPGKKSKAPKRKGTSDEDGYRSRKRAKKER